MHFFLIGTDPVTAGPTRTGRRLLMHMDITLSLWCFRIMSSSTRCSLVVLVAAGLSCCNSSSSSFPEECRSTMREWLWTYNYSQVISMENASLVLPIGDLLTELQRGECRHETFLVELWRLKSDLSSQKLQWSQEEIYNYESCSQLDYHFKVHHRRMVNTADRAPNHSIGNMSFSHVFTDKYILRVCDCDLTEQGECTCDYRHETVMCSNLFTAETEKIRQRCQFSASVSTPVVQRNRTTITGILLMPTPPQA